MQGIITMTVLRTINAQTMNSTVKTLHNVLRVMHSTYCMRMIYSILHILRVTMMNLCIYKYTTKIVAP